MSGMIGTTTTTKTAQQGTTIINIKQKIRNRTRHQILMQKSALVIVKRYKREV